MSEMPILRSDKIRVTGIPSEIAERMAEVLQSGVTGLAEAGAVSEAMLMKVLHDAMHRSADDPVSERRVLLPLTPLECFQLVNILSAAAQVLSEQTEERVRKLLPDHPDESPSEFGHICDHLRELSESALAGISGDVEDA